VEEVVRLTYLYSIFIYIIVIYICIYIFGIIFIYNSMNHSIESLTVAIIIYAKQYTYI
jgi:hypothetical protein